MEMRFWDFKQSHTENGKPLKEWKDEFRITIHLNEDKTIKFLATEFENIRVFEGVEIIAIRDWKKDKKSLFKTFKGYFKRSKIKSNTKILKKRKLILN